ncbi:hypothetical protein AMYX_34300 [Anaeromyxobacter diazotrophicus]|uniref:Lipoprotein n=1 Tax=Anaeromyxobacter diazotrophicus TaxID=2590199 RepID=A0A7I9VRJ2_9BACT|nr:hypothetical protein AMYX_34300 [Anaeromyxobacter diazotrophicus]
MRTDVRVGGAGIHGLARSLLVAAAFLFVGCAHFKDAEAVCEDSRGLRCLTAPECSFDRARGCEVCQCRPLSERGGPLMPPPFTPQ